MAFVRVPGEFPAQRASNVENVFIWWRHHAPSMNQYQTTTSRNQAEAVYMTLSI